MIQNCSSWQLPLHSSTRSMSTNLLEL